MHLSAQRLTARVATDELLLELMRRSGYIASSVIEVACGPCAEVPVHLVRLTLVRRGLDDSAPLRLTVYAHVDIRLERADGPC